MSKVQEVLLSKLIEEKNLPQPHWDTAKGKISIPELYSPSNIIIPEWNKISDEVQEKINETFGLNLPEEPIRFESLTNLQKIQIRRKFEKWIASKKNKLYPNGIIQSKRDYVSSTDELLKLLDMYNQSKCFHIEDKDTGKLRGVIPPKSKMVQISGPLIPWKAIMIDFKAQRHTDGLHILKLWLRYDPYKNYGCTVRFTTDGNQCDTNDGRHSLMLFGMVGVAFVPVRGPISDMRTTNMDIFQSLNSQAKPITLIDDLKFMNSRACLTMEYFNSEQKIHTDREKFHSGLVASDKEVYEMFKLVDKFDVELVSSELGKRDRRHIKPRQMFRPDQLIEHLQNNNYSFWNEDLTELKDTFVKDTLKVLDEVIFDYDGYFPHEIMMGICHLLSLINPGGKPTDDQRKKAIQVFITVLQNFLPAPSDSGKAVVRDTKDRPYRFYLEVTRLKDRIPEKIISYEGKEISNPVHKFASKTYIEGIIASFLYQLIQDDPTITKPDKNLFVRPTVSYRTGEEDEKGNLIRKTVYLEDLSREPVDGVQPLIGLHSWPRFGKTKENNSQDYLRVEDDDEDE